MKLAMICFSLNGRETGEKLKYLLESKSDEVRFVKKSKYIADGDEINVDDWTREQFAWADAILFIGACGIAVRHIAPYIKSKKKDPAVLVTDECGKFVISLLSGHLGGANELAAQLAEMLDAIPVITTATDLQHCFAVDVFARKNKCEIFQMQAAKDVSAALLAGKKVGFYSDFSWEGSLPKGLVLCDKNGKPYDENGNVQENAESFHTGVAVTIYKDRKPFSLTTSVVPKTVVLGMGCRRGKDAEGILEAAWDAIQMAGIYKQAVSRLVSIDLKKEEEGLKKLSETWEIPFLTYSTEELSNVSGEFSVSSFVKSITGVDNVCERSAVLGSEYGKLIQRKNGRDGVTTALAMKEWRIHFE